LSDSTASVYDRRFVLFTGKGGVGKTTIASAFALSCARRGERTLLVQINTTDKMGRLFGSGEVGTDIVEIEDNLFAVNVTPAAAMEEYALMMLKVRLVYKAVFENRIVSSFLRAVPGLNELVMLGKAYYHVIEEEDGKRTWDKVVVDAPATGHGIFFLQIPSVITSILESGNMYDEAARMQAVLSDPEVTALNIVTLPEEMPVNETFMMWNAARDKLDMQVATVIANAVYASRFDDDDISRFAELRDEIDDPEIGGLLDAAAFRARREGIQRNHLERLADIDAPVVTIPFIFAEHLDFQSISTIAERLVDTLGGDA
jgi:anion-transporting  ArsA/GET3 family ATPase